MHMLGLIKRYFNHITVSTFILLYKNTLDPILITVAQFCPLQEKNEVEALEKVQKKATKVLTKLKHKNCTERDCL